MSQKDQGMTHSDPYKWRQKMFLLDDMHDKTFTRYEHMKANIYGDFKPSLQNGNSLQKNIDLKWTRKSTSVIFGRHIEYLSSRLSSMFEYLGFLLRHLF